MSQHSCLINELSCVACGARITGRLFGSFVIVDRTVSWEDGEGPLCEAHAPVWPSGAGGGGSGNSGVIAHG